MDEEMIERIKRENARGLSERRDYNEEELQMIREGREADAKAHWHSRTGK